MANLLENKRILEGQIAQLVNQFHMDNNLDEVSITLDVMYEYGESEFVEGSVFKGINIQCTLLM